MGLCFNLFIGLSPCSVSNDSGRLALAFLRGPPPGFEYEVGRAVEPARGGKVVFDGKIPFLQKSADLFRFVVVPDRDKIPIDDQFFQFFPLP